MQIPLESLASRISIFHTSHLFLYRSSGNSHHIHNNNCNSLVFFSIRFNSMIFEAISIRLSSLCLLHVSMILSLILFLFLIHAFQTDSEFQSIELVLSLKLIKTLIRLESANSIETIAIAIAIALMTRLILTMKMKMKLILTLMMRIRIKVKMRLILILMMRLFQFRFFHVTIHVKMLILLNLLLNEKSKKIRFCKIAFVLTMIEFFLFFRIIDLSQNKSIFIIMRSILVLMMKFVKFIVYNKSEMRSLRSELVLVKTKKMKND